MNISFIWIATVVLLYISIIAYGSSRIHSGFYLKVICKGNSGKKRIALTFDDGPHENTTEILNFLNQHSIKAAFFCIGKNIEIYPQTVKRINAEGHVIANHSYLHLNTFPINTCGKILKEITDTQTIIEKVTGTRNLYFRPPFGVTNPSIAKAVKKSGLIPVGWSIRSFDLSSKTTEKITSGIMKRLTGDDIVLLHDKSEKALAILSQLFHDLKEKGWEIVPLDAILNKTHN